MEQGMRDARKVETNKIGNVLRACKATAEEKSWSVWKV